MLDSLKAGGRKRSVRLCIWNVLLALCMLIHVSANWAQNTIHVPADQPTIQAGIDAAKNGDTVLVATGTYTENIDFTGKAITVTSGATNSAGAAAAIINGNQQIPAVIFRSGETRASVLNGFTIQNGLTGVYLPSSSATISNNIITSNVACGIAATGQAAGPLITGNTISHTRYVPNVECLAPNQPYYNFDGSQRDTAIWLFEAGTVEITGNTIENNGVLVQGLGSYPEPLGEGIFSESIYNTTTVIIKNNTVINNYLDDTAIDVGQAVNVTISQNLVANNTSVGTPASGINANGNGNFRSLAPTYSLVVVNNTAYGNINVDDPAKNPAQTGNQGSFYTGPTNVNPFVIENNLFIAIDKFGTVGCGNTANSNIVYSNNDAFYAGASQPLLCQGTGSSNLSVNPEFLSPGTGNFFTQRTSPVVAAGDVNAPDLPATDLAGKNRTVCGTVDMGVYEVHPIPAISLSSSPNPSVGGTSVTINASVAGNCNVPTGILTFYAGSTLLGTATLSSAGTAVFSTAALTVGSDTITATYPGDFNFDPSTSSPLIQVVTGYPTATTLQVLPNPAKAFQAITFSATVTSQFGTPNGTISFLAGNTVLAIAPLNSAGSANATVTSFGAGTYNITAVYNPSVTYAGSVSPIVIEIVDGYTTTTTLSSVPNPSLYGQAVTFIATVAASQTTTVPTGSVSFQEGQTVLGSAVVSGSGLASFTTSALAVGSHTVTASYKGSSNANSSSSSIVQIVQLASSSVTLTGTPNPAALGSTVTLQATVTSLGGQPSGVVQFSDQFGLLGTGTLTAGQAIFSTNTLPSGTHNIIAIYAGGAKFADGVSPVLSEVIQSFDFLIKLSPARLSLAQGKKGQVSVQIAGVGNLPGNISFRADQIPVYAAVSFTPTPVAFPAGGAGLTTFSIDTVQEPPQHAMLKTDPTGSGSGPSVSTFAALCTVPLLLLRRRRLRNLLWAVIVSAAIIGMSGCTNIYYPLNQVSPGTYTIPITGIDTTSGISHTATLTLTVTP